jgi:hypothetical protein
MAARNQSAAAKKAWATMRGRKRSKTQSERGYKAGETMAKRKKAAKAYTKTDVRKGAELAAYRRQAKRYKSANRSEGTIRQRAAAAARKKK